MTGIHPAPTEFSKDEISVDPILRYFHYAHLPEHLQRVSRPFCQTARCMIDALPRNAERTAGLRKLLEAKDCAVRARVAEMERWRAGAPSPTRSKPDTLDPVSDPDAVDIEKHYVARDALEDAISREAKVENYMPLAVQIACAYVADGTTLSARASMCAVELIEALENRLGEYVDHCARDWS